MNKWEDTVKIRMLELNWRPVYDQMFEKKTLVGFRREENYISYGDAMLSLQLEDLKARV